MNLSICNITRAVLCISCLVAAVFAQPRRPMAPADIVRVATVSDAQISPNGQWVVYTLTTSDDDKSVNSLWLARAGSDSLFNVPFGSPTAPRRTAPYPHWSQVRGGSTPLLSNGWNASTARWSPDSNTIAFLSNHEELDGLWIVRMERREPRFFAAIQSTNFFITYAEESFSWTPDSRRIGYISGTPESVYTAGPSRRADDPRVIDRIQYKSRTAFSDNRRTHVWITAVERPEPRQLTSGQFYDHAMTFS